jgi:hypothetical protein
MPIIPKERRRDRKLDTEAKTIWGHANGVEINSPNYQRPIHVVLQNAGKSTGIIK